MTAPRKVIPDATIADLLISTRRRCCLCYFLSNDDTQKRVQVAHIDHKRNNDSPENLVPLCLAHHDEYDSRTSQSKGITQEEVRRYKSMLIAEFSHDRDNIKIEINVEEGDIPAFENELFYGYGILFSRISRLLFQFDPVRINYEDNLDEYDPEAHDIISRLQNNRECLSTAQICKAVMERWFSEGIARSFDQYAELAMEVDVAWERFKARNYVYGARNAF